MVEYLGGSVSTLLVEPDDATAASYTAARLHFSSSLETPPSGENQDDALASIDHGPHRIDQVGIGGRVTKPSIWVNVDGKCALRLYHLPEHTTLAIGPNDFEMDDIIIAADNVVLMIEAWMDLSISN